MDVSVEEAGEDGQPGDVDDLRPARKLDRVPRPGVVDPPTADNHRGIVDRIGSGAVDQPPSDQDTDHYIVAAVHTSTGRGKEDHQDRDRNQDGGSPSHRASSI
jgi:hypothetical protein